MKCPKFLFAFLLLLCHNCCTGQIADSILQRIDSLFKHLPLNISDTHEECGHTLDDVVKLFSRRFSDQSNLDSLYLAYKHASGSDLGLQLKVNGRINFRNSLFEENLAEGQGRTLLQTGLQWNILKDGFKANKLLSQNWANDYQLSKIRQSHIDAKLQYGFRYENIIYVFNKMALSHIERQIHFLNEQRSIFDYLKSKYYITAYDILKLEKKIAVKKAQLHQIKSYNTNYPFADFPLECLPVFDMNIDEIMEAFLSNVMYDSITDLKIEQVQNSAKIKNLPRLNLYGQLQSIRGFENNYQITPMVGVQFMLPLKRKVPQQVVKYQMKDLRAKAVIEQGNTLKEIRVRYFEFTEKLKQWRRIKHDMLLSEEAMFETRQSFKQLVPEMLFESLNLAYDLSEEQLERIFVQSQLYLKALGILTLADLCTPDKWGLLITPIETALNASTNVIVYWDSAKVNVNFSQMVTFLKRKHIRKIKVTDSSGYNRKSELVSRLEKEGFDLDPDLSGYELIELQKEDDYKKVNRKLNWLSGYWLIDDVHLFYDLQLKSIYEKIQF